MTTDTVSWLTQEVHDLLDAGSVGLYEFMWTLNTPDQPLSVDERRSVARQALQHLLDEPGVELAWLRWPDWTELRKITIDELPDDPWHDPDENGMYVALVRTD